MKRTLFLFAALAALAIGTLFLHVPNSLAAPSLEVSSHAEAPLAAAMPLLVGLGAVALVAMLGLNFLRDGASNLSPKQSLANASRTTSGTGTAVDLRGFDEATCVFRFESWTAGTFTGTVQESDTTTSGDFTDVADADLIGTEPVVDASNEDDVEYKVGYKGNKRYIRLNIIGSGSPLTAMINGAYVIRGRPHQNTSV